MPEPTSPAATPTIHLSRWTVTSGSNAQSRGAVLIASGDHQWRASAEGNGAIDALYTAVDKALAEILTGHPRLLAYDIHALGEGTDTIGVVTVRVAPPDVAGARGTGEYAGEARSTNIIAASIEAYLAALNAMLAETHWEGAPEGGRGDRHASSQEHAGPRRRGPRPARGTRRGRRRDRHDRLVQPVAGSGPGGPPRLRRPCPTRLPSPMPGSPARSPRMPSWPRFGDVPRTPLGSFRAVFEAVATGDAPAGVVPIENVINGTVRENYDLLIEHDLVIRGEVVVPVSLCLAALPGERVDGIERVYSHIQALGQAEAFLRSRPWQLLTTYNTAGAGKAIADQGERGAAAVLSPRAAALFGLEILADGIGDLPDNKTRFLVLARAGPAGRRACSGVDRRTGRRSSSRSATSPGRCSRCWRCSRSTA